MKISSESLSTSTALMIHSTDELRENTVTSCRKCNGRKGSTLPKNLKDIGMTLAREPWTPTKWELAANAQKMVPKKVHSTWKPFLGLNVVPGEQNEAEEAFFNEIDDSS